MRLARFALALALGTLAQAACLEQPAAQEGLAKIKTIVVIYGENRSFDHMYGFFPARTALRMRRRSRRRSSTMTASPFRSSRYSEAMGRRTRALSACRTGRS